MVQFRLGPGGEPDQAVYAQHSWAERCGAPRGAPVVFVANGSHAAYVTAGVHNRPWPDPNDYARGDGKRIRPPVVRITRDSPAWMRRPHPWGSSEAEYPGEESSPLGPGFQHERFDDPGAWAAGGRACGSGAPGLPAAAIAAFVAGSLALLGGGVWLATRRHYRS